MENEIWKQIKGYPRYMVSNQGRVKSFTSGKHPEGKLIKSSTNANGYEIVWLQSGTKRGKNGGKHFQLHRLVAETFIPVPAELRWCGKKNLQVDHIVPLKNGGKPTVDNLRWCTPKGNAWNPLTTENRNRYVESRMMKVYQYDKDLNLIATYPSTAEAARQLNKSQGNITSCCQGSLPTYLGYIFSYTEITSQKQREELVEASRPQAEKNRKNTYKAMTKWIEKKKKNGEEYNWYKKNPEAYRKWYEKNKEKIRERHRRWYAKWKEERDKSNNQSKTAGKDEGVLPAE